MSGARHSSSSRSQSPARATSSHGSAIHSSAYTLSCRKRCGTAAAARRCAWRSGSPIVATCTTAPRRPSSDASVSAYENTPPTPSAVMSTHNPRSDGSATVRSSLELDERAWPALLDVAEGVELGQVVLVRTLPRLVVGRAEAQGVLGRPRVWKERHRLVRPYAVIAQAAAPRVDLVGSIARRIQEVRLDEGDARLRVDQELGE